MRPAVLGVRLLHFRCRLAAQAAREVRYGRKEGLT